MMQPTKNEHINIQTFGWLKYLNCLANASMSGQDAYFRTSYIWNEEVARPGVTRSRLTLIFKVLIDQRRFRRINWSIANVQLLP